MESSFDLDTLTKLAQQKANAEGMTQYILIEPLNNQPTVSRFKGEGDKVLREVKPSEETSAHLPSDVWLLRQGDDVQVLVCCCTRWHRVIVKRSDGSFSHNASLNDVHRYPEVSFYNETSKVSQLTKGALLKWATQFEQMKVVGKCHSEPAIGLTVVLHFDNFLVVATKESLQIDGTLHGRTPPHLVSLIGELAEDYKGPEWTPLNAGALVVALARVT